MLMSRFLYSILQITTPWQGMPFGLMMATIESDEALPRYPHMEDVEVINPLA